MEKHDAGCEMYSEACGCDSMELLRKELSELRKELSELRLPMTSYVQILNGLAVQKQ